MKSRQTIHGIGIVFFFLLILPLISEAGDILPADGTASGYFGGSVSISDVYAVAGASGDNSSKGAVYVFRNTGGIESYVQAGKLTADDGTAADRLGVAVSVSGVYVIAGANGDDDKGNDSGSAYMFLWNGSAWTQQKKLVASDGAAGDRFGESVSVSGDYALVGSSYDDDRGADSGAAYIFKREGTTWTQQKKLIPSDSGSGDYFGSAVSVSGDYALVGAHLSKNSLTNTGFGAAYIFKREASGWNQKAKLTADDGAVNDFFGHSVSLYCDGTSCYAVIGADGDDTAAGRDSGSVYIFKRNSDDTWTQTAHVYASDSAEGDSFGKSVSVYGQGSYWVLIAGADKNDEAGSNSGAAYIFSLSGSAWSQKEKLVPASGGTNDYYGRSVGIFGYNVIAGAPNRDVSGKGTDVGGISAEKILITDPGVPPPDTYPSVYNLSDQSTPKNTTLAVKFTVYDAETSAASLQVTAVSKNTALVPQNAVVTGGSGAERTLTITPASGKYGTAVITVTVKDGNGNKTEASFTLTVNNPPTITGLDTAVTVNQNTSSGPLSFRISDEKTPASQLKVTAASSDTTRVPLSNMVFSGSAEDRTVTITPARDQTGTSTITVSVTDTDNDTASKSFAFSVRGAPSISDISDKTTDEDTPVYISFTVGDAVTPAENLIVSYSWVSSNMSEANISLGGSGSNRKLTIIPPANEYGTARITVSVKIKTAR